MSKRRRRKRIMIEPLKRLQRTSMLTMENRKIRMAKRRRVMCLLKNSPRSIVVLLTS